MGAVIANATLLSTHGLPLKERLITLCRWEKYHRIAKTAGRPLHPMGRLSSKMKLLLPLARLIVMADSLLHRQ